MIGIIVVTHGDFGQSLLNAASMIMGDDDNCHFLGVDVTRPMNEIIEELKSRVAEMDQGQGVLILTDMFGGTPTNISLSLLNPGSIEVITGVNLPMLLKALGGRTKKIEDLAQEIKGAGKQGILVAGEVLKRKIPDTQKKA
ncbi:PTS sugar transporter subunit IIA [Desulfonatronovibrio magnus]|uniref:PTS sugar transporter subunit IIA n=1 Tax=Desulfonatronovibrio magnus TaxID=698827 RepID=UPI0005EB110D|nr:PTS sugar transporter subunit IIA [Desulfonatronovibrio magnus]